MGIMEICNEIGAKYGIRSEDLEAGYYPPSEMLVLTDLYQKWMQQPSEDNARAYIEQKAKFLSLRGE